MTRVSVAHRPEITHGADIVLRLAAATAPLQVGVTSRRPAASPAGADGAKSAELAREAGKCSYDGRGDDCSKHVAEDHHTKAGKNDESRHGSKEARNDDGEHKKDYQPQQFYRSAKLSDDCGKNPGEALATFDFSNL